MNVIFFIQVGAKEHISFGNPFEDISGDATTVFDLDNHSDQTTLHYATILLEKAARVFIVIREHEPSPPGLLTSFFEKVIRSKEKPFWTCSLGETSLPQGIKVKLGIEVKSVGDTFALLREFAAD